MCYKILFYNYYFDIFCGQLSNNMIEETLMTVDERSSLDVIDYA